MSPFGSYNDKFTQGEGKHYFSFSACDSAGNCSAFTDPYSVTYDKTPPSTPSGLYYEANGKVLSCNSFTDSYNITAKWGASSDTNFSNYEYRSFNPPTGWIWTGGNVGNTPSRSGAFTVGEGAYGFAVRAVDKAGNVSNWTSENLADSCKITYDKTQPTITDLVVNKNYAKTGDILTITAEVTDSSGISAVSADFSYNPEYTNRPTSTSVGMTNTGGNTYSVSYTIPSSWNEGTMYIKVAARDKTGGNWVRSSSSKQVVVDNTVPVLDHKTNFEGWFNSAQTSTFHYTDDNMADGYADPTCEIDTEGADQTCSITPNICDKAGNCNTTTQISDGANIDFTAPASVITYPEGDNEGIVYVNNWNGTISGTASDNLSGVRKVELVIKRDINGAVTYWDGSGWQTNEIYVLATETNSWTYGPLALPLIEGTYTIESHATDNAGNTENTYKLTIVLDKTIPTVDLAINPTNPDGDNGWYVSSPNIILTANDKNLDKIEYKINSGNWTTYANPVRIDDGKYVLYYRSLDKAGNYSDEGVKNVKADTREPDHIKNVDADWNADTKKVKLSWDVEDSDIDKVYIYRGGRKGFHVNNDTKIAENDDNDESYSDDDRKPGEKYYYKFVSRDKAGNSSDVKIISVRIPLEESEEAIVIDEGTEPIEVAGEETTVEEKEESSSEEENSAGEEAILGDEGIQSSGETSQDVEVLGEQKTKSYIAKIQDVARAWQFWLFFLLVISFAVWYLKRRKKAE
jgi:hypothetical protein